MKRVEYEKLDMHACTKNQENRTGKKDGIRVFWKRFQDFLLRGNNCILKAKLD